ncbi:hypothetical protein [Rhizobium sp. 768_B6_N1_8]|uniref:hypothetical protein n=1 Tax=unclassified Rhizobium TaxID=2613769 RepID=UPI003F25F5E1
MPTTIYLDATAGETELRKALTTVSNGGGTVVLSKDADITVSKAIYVAVGSGDVTVDLNGGTLHQATGSERVLGVFGAESPLQTVALASDAMNNATITYTTLPQNITVGSWIKVTADDNLPGDHVDPGDAGQTTKLGQAAKVIAINGNTVTLEGSLVEQNLYATNVRATVYAEGQFAIKNGTIDGAAGEYNAATADLLHLRNLVDAVVENVTVKDGGFGVNVVNNVNATLSDITATNLYCGIHTGSSLSTQINGLFAEHVGQGVVVQGIGTAANASSAASYGAEIGLLAKNSVVYDAANSAYDFHSESRNGVYTDDLSFNSRMFGDFRGIGNAFTNSGSAGDAYGIQFYEYGDGDGRNSLVDNLILREIKNYAFMISNSPEANIVKNSIFESYLEGYNIPESMVKFINTLILTNVVPGDDTLVGTAAADKLLGGLGADNLSGGDGDDYLWGGDKADVQTGGTGHDRFAYHALSEGGDIITDFQVGGNGDVIDVSVLAARLGWGSGSDLIADGHIRVIQSGTSAVVQANDGQGWSTLATLQNASASNFDTRNLQTALSATAQWSADDPSASLPSPTAHTGTDKADSFAAAKGADLYYGSAGDDSYVFNDARDRVTGELAAGGKDTIWSSVSVDLRNESFVENLRLSGSTEVDGIGNALGNLITGNAQSNTIAGAGGNDSLYGGGGADTFYFSEMGATNKDSIWDFSEDDKIALSQSIFAGLDANGDHILDQSAFVVVSKLGALATGAGPQIIYNSASGIVSYDADGSGEKAAQDIAFIGANKAFFSYDDVLLSY